MFSFFMIVISFYSNSTDVETKNTFSSTKMDRTFYGIPTVSGIDSNIDLSTFYLPTLRNSDF